MTKNVYVVCRDFGLESLMFFHSAYGWGKEKVEMFDSEIDARLECQAELCEEGASVEKFVTSNQAQLH